MALKQINYLFSFVLLGIPLLVIPSAANRFSYPKVILLYLIFGLMVVVYLKNRNQLKIEEDKLTYLLLLYLITLLFTTIFSVDPYHSIVGTDEREEGLLALFTYGFLFIFTKNFFRFNIYHMIALVLATTLVSAYALSQHFGFDPLFEQFTERNIHQRPYSTIGNPNFLGAFLVLTLPVFSLFFLKTKKIYHLIFSLLIFSALIITYTRSAMIGFVMTVLLLIAYRLIEPNIKKEFRSLLLSFTIIIVLLNSYSHGFVAERFLSISSEAKTVISKDEDYERTGSNRIYIWTKTLALIKERPLTGYGLENLGTVFNASYNEETIERFGRLITFDKAHNEYLHIAVTTGIPSLLFYLSFLIIVLFKGVAHSRHDWRYLPFLIGAAAYLVQAFFNISVISVAPLFWIFLGILANPFVFKSTHKDILF